ncbi:MAG: type II toxin-antitoxin system Phd/YefM family antitoxin [Chloroflexota bacterium]
MERSIPAFEARRQFGKLLQNVTAKGDSYVVERHGEPVAVVVSIEIYEQWKRQRSAFFATWRQVAEGANLSTDDADMLAKETVQAVRRDHAV